MSKLPRTIEENQKHIIGGGLIIGILSIFDYLPETTEFLGLGGRIKYLLFTYIIFCFFLIYRKKGISIQRTVPTRNLSNPSYRQEIGRQYVTGGSGGLRYPSPPRENIPPNINEQFRRRK